MTRLLILVTLLAVAVAPTLGEAASSKRLHVIATVVDQAFIGDPEHPKLGDRLINNVTLRDDRGKQVGTGGAVCTVVAEPPQTTVQCLLSAEFADGQIVFGGSAEFPVPGAVGHFGILGGTGRFSKARGEATLIVLPNGDVDSTFDLD